MADPEHAESRAVVFDRRWLLKQTFTLGVMVGAIL
jgi:hypothetical protein